MITLKKMTHQNIDSLLGAEAEQLLQHSCGTITKDQIHLTGPRHVEQVFNDSDRSKAVKQSLRRLYHHGRLGDSGYLSIFPVDQGVEHTAGYSFVNNPDYFDPENVVKLALEAGCNGVVSTLGVLGLVSGKYADQIPFIVKLNHNERLTQPHTYDQVMFAQVKQAGELGAAGVGATIYFGSPQARRQIQEVSQAFAQAHRHGMFTVLWTYPRNSDWLKDEVNYESAADITGQANYLGVTIEADLIKQKMPTVANGFQVFDFGKYKDEMYPQLIGNHPIDWVRYQVANCYLGKIGLINSGGASQGEDDLAMAVKSAVINKRGGGSGMIMGRKVFNRPFEKGVALVQAVQDVYLDEEIGVA